MRGAIMRLAAATLLLAGPAMAATSDGPPMPMRIENICPADDCFFGHWTVLKPMVGYAKEGQTKNVVFNVKAGEQVLAMAGHLHILEAGKAQVGETFIDPPDATDAKFRFFAGNYLYILAPRGNDFYDVWYNGRRRGASFLMAPSKYFMPGRDRVKLIKNGRWIWWVMAKTKAGKIGWLRFPNIITSDIKELKKKKGGWKVRPVPEVPSQE